jgi:uncharacterized protein YpmB
LKLLPQTVARREQLSQWIVGIAVGILLLFIVAVGYVSVSTHQLVNAHSKDISQTTQAIKDIENLQQVSSSRHHVEEAYLQAICKALPGCVPPP